MAVELSPSLQVARKVLEAVMADERTQSTDAYVEAYQNGREQGYCIVRSQFEPAFETLAISFAENRNSDDIVVHAGPMAMQGLSERAWHNRRLFRYDDLSGAVAYIVDLLTRPLPVAELGEKALDDRKIKR